MITEQQKDEALKTLEQYTIEQKHQLRDISADCPTKDFEHGTPRGNCEGDGHYMCNECINHRIE